VSEWTVVTLKEHFETLRVADQRALDLKGTEIERRLALLNGEHAALATMAQTYVPREVYERDLERLRLDRIAADVESKRARETAEISAKSGRRSMAIAMIGLGSALIGWAITVVLHFFPDVPKP
jgi:hypothetical protein